MPILYCSWGFSRYCDTIYHHSTPHSQPFPSASTAQESFWLTGFLLLSELIKTPLSLGSSDFIYLFFKQPGFQQGNLNNVIWQEQVSHPIWYGDTGHK